jgi:DMSO/TMAO reductase YedYZ heme-binding membrane subunit
VAHVGSLLSDKYAGVNWRSLVVPDAATYRPGAVTYGMVAAELMVLVIVTAALAGRWGVGARWAVVHKLAYPAFVLTWVHGVLAGTDTQVLRGLYVAEGLAVLLAAAPVLLRDTAWARARATE